MPCCEEMAQAEQVSMPCHKTQQEKAPVQQHQSCLNCICLHCPATAGILPVPASAKPTVLSMAYFTVSRTLNSHAGEVFYPPPKFRS